VVSAEARHAVSLEMEGVAAGSRHGHYDYGDGAYLSESEATLRDVDFVGNAAGEAAGGLALVGGSQATPEGVLLYHNYTVRGGGLYLLDSEASLLDCEVSGNDSEWRGGGIAVNGGALTLEGVDLSKNVGGQGGGLFGTGGEISLAEVSLRENVAMDDKGYWIESAGVNTWGESASFTCDADGCL